MVVLRSYENEESGKFSLSVKTLSVIIFVGNNFRHLTKSRHFLPTKYQCRQKILPFLEFSEWHIKLNSMIQHPEVEVKICSVSKVFMCQARFTGFVYIMLIQGQSVHCWIFYQMVELISTTDWYTWKVYFVFWVNHVAFKLHRLFTFLPPKHSVHPKALYCALDKTKPLFVDERFFSRLLKDSSHKNVYYG